LADGRYYTVVVYSFTEAAQIHESVQQSTLFETFVFKACLPVMLSSYADSYQWIFM